MNRIIKAKRLVDDIMTRNSNGLHDRRVRHLFNNPHILGIENVIAKGMEVDLLLDGALVAKPDIIYFDGDHYFVTEYQCSTSGRRRAFSQFKVERLWFQRFVKRSPVCLYVTGMYYDVEVVGR